jgi:hypothetical protein
MRWLLKENQGVFKAACKRRLQVAQRLARVSKPRSQVAPKKQQRLERGSAENQIRSIGPGSAQKRAGRQRAAARKRREQQGPGRAAGGGAKGAGAK